MISLLVLASVGLAVLFCVYVVGVLLRVTLCGALLPVGRWNIRRLKTQADMKKLIGLDPFHSFLNQSTTKIILRIVSVVSGGLGRAVELRLLRRRKQHHFNVCRRPHRHYRHLRIQCQRAY